MPSENDPEVTKSAAVGGIGRAGDKIKEAEASIKSAVSALDSVAKDAPWGIEHRCRDLRATLEDLLPKMTSLYKVVERVDKADEGKVDDEDDESEDSPR